MLRSYNDSNMNCNTFCHGSLACRSLSGFKFFQRISHLQVVHPCRVFLQILQLPVKDKRVIKKRTKVKTQNGDVGNIVECYSFQLISHSEPWISSIDLILNLSHLYCAPQKKVSQKKKTAQWLSLEWAHLRILSTD